MCKKKFLKKCFYFFILMFLTSSYSFLKSQTIYDLQETIISPQMINNIVNEISGTLPYNHMIEMAGYNRDRKKEEYEGLYWESEYIVNKAKEYGFSDAHIEHFPQDYEQWDAEVGELWLVEPEERLLISCRDVPPCLVPGSHSDDVSAEVVYVDSELDSLIYSRNYIEGKIVLTSGQVRNVYPIANNLGAVGVIGYGYWRTVDYPDQIMWSSIRVPEGASANFAFSITPRLGYEIKKLLDEKKRVKIRSIVKTNFYKTDMEVATALIPGDGNSKQEVVLCGHLFEGITKQGALDNISGCAAILEAGRTLIKLIEEGKIDRPKRSIKFLWVPEISGTSVYLRKHKDEVQNIVAAINLDMVGEDVKKNHNSLNLYRSVDSRGSFLNDICQEFFEYVGITNRESILNPSWIEMRYPIFDPNGSRDPFYYNIENYYGSSDHLVFLGSEFGKPAVMFNNWPDMFYHTNEDTPDKADPTQLKRAVFIAFASAYVIANAGVNDISKISALVYGKGNVRIMKEVEKGLQYLVKSDSYHLKERFKETKNKINGAFIREGINIESLRILAEGNIAPEEEISKIRKNLVENEKSVSLMLTEFYKIMCNRFKIDSEEITLTKDEVLASKITPVLVKPDSKRDLSSFERRSFSTLSQFSRFELLNFIDSGLSLLNIRDSILSQFGDVRIEDVVNFYKNLEDKGIIKLANK